MLAGIVLFVLGSALAALAQSFEVLLLGRFVQALGAAAGAVTPRAIIADSCDVQTSARVFSMLMQIMIIAPISAPIIGSLTLLIGPWQLIFWILAGAGMLAGLFSLRMLPETLPPEKRLPISIRNILRNYFKLLAHPRFLLFTLASSFTVGGLFTYISNSPFVFIQHYGLSPNQYGLIFAASASAMILTGQINLRLLRLYKPLQVLFMGLLCFIGAACTLGVLVLLKADSVWSYALTLGLCLSMLGMISGNLTAITMGYAGQFAGVASSLMGMLQFLLAGLLGFVINLTPTTLLTLPVTLGYFGVAAFCLCFFASRATLPK